MGLRTEIFAARLDQEIVQPVQLFFSQVTSETTEEGFEKFVAQRRKDNQHITAAVLMPLLIQMAEDVILYDHKNFLVGKIEGIDDLPRFVADNQDRLNLNQPGTVRTHFEDDSMFSFQVPLDISQVIHSDPTSIEY